MTEKTGVTGGDTTGVGDTSSGAHNDRADNDSTGNDRASNDTASNDSTGRGGAGNDRASNDSAGATVNGYGRKPDGVNDWIKVRAHPALCIGWGNCQRWSHGLYPLDEEGQIDIHVLEVPPERAVDAWMGAQACPEGAISIVSVERRR